ncbi:MAG: lipocalin family protein [Tunicatimonas sp.]|uniref:lipocalin family protein n=1 Tax=Tunicatimonas sp. TaxID=1940096 RepID=UPI003C792520
MKNLQKLFSTTLVVCLAITLFSCNKDDEQLSTEVGIIGKWQIESADIIIDGKSYEDYIEESINELKQQLGSNYSEEMGDAVRESLEEFDADSAFENTTIEFKSDKTVIVTDEDDSGTGTWVADGKQLTINFEDESQKYTVRSLTNSRASLSIDGGFDDIEMEEADLPMATEMILNLKK